MKILYGIVGFLWGAFIMGEVYRLSTYINDPQITIMDINNFSTLPLLICIVAGSSLIIVLEIS